MLQRVLRAAQRVAATGQLSFPPSPVPFIRRKFGGKPCTFVQVGSNDGVDGDPIHDLIMTNPQWRGLLIEPLPEPFARLTESYRGRSGLYLEQIAISDALGTRPFYYVPRSAGEGRRLPAGFDQMGSFDRAHIVKHGADLEPLIVETTIACQPLSSVLRSYRMAKVDLIHIDTEGYDYEVLKQIDFDSFGVRLVLYENVHLSAADAGKAEELLRANGFEIINCGFDTLARSTSQRAQ